MTSISVTLACVVGCGDTGLQLTSCQLGATQRDVLSEGWINCLIDDRSTERGREREREGPSVA